MTDHEKLVAHAHELGIQLARETARADYECRRADEMLRIANLREADRKRLVAVLLAALSDHDLRSEVARRQATAVREGA